MTLELLFKSAIAQLGIAASVKMGAIPDISEDGLPAEALNEVECEGWS